MTAEAAPVRSPPVEDPYVGLAYFTEEYVDFFFGRDNESALVIGNLRASRLTLLYAESGVGKSSVLRAGVVARLHELAERDRGAGGQPRLVPIVFSSWSERPIAGLVQEIGEEARRYLTEEEVPELPEDDLEAALEAAGEALGATLLVILDQFEEYFLYPDQGAEQDGVAAQIARCVNRPDLRANFLISIREDAYAELGDLFRGKLKNVYGNFLHLDFLNRAGGREAIEKPIARLNELRPEAEPFAIEPALVAAVLDQVRLDEGDERIETTYLQLVMRRLWEEERASGSRLLRLRTLEGLGGAQAIIGSHLDRAMEAGADGGAGLSSEQRLTAARIFRFLVTSGGAKIALTAGDLAELSELSAAQIEPVLRHLSSPQLHILRPVVFQDDGSEPRFEIFHDALAGPIRKWRTEVEEEERNARLRRERAEKEDAQRAAAEAERQAERERQRKRVAQGLLALAVLALLVGATVFALNQKSQADQSEADSQSIQAAERISELAWAPSFGPAAAALASVEAYGLSPTAEARKQALAQLQLNPGLPTIVAGHTQRVESVAFEPGSGVLVSGGDETVRRWNRQGVEIGKPLAAGGEVLEVAVAGPTKQGARVIAAGLRSGEVKLWTVPRGGEPKELPRLPNGRTRSPRARGVAFSPADPELLAVGASAGQVTLWSLRDPARPDPLGTASVPGEVEDLAFAGDGRRLLVASTEAGAALDLSGRGFEGTAPVAEVDGATSAAAAAPDGSYAFGGRGGVELWPADGRRVRLKPPGRVDALAFARGGSVLISAGTDWNVTTWDVASRRPFGPPRAANRASLNDLAVSAGGDVAAAGDDRLVKVWPLEQPGALAYTLGALSAEQSGRHVPELFDLASGGRRKLATAAGRVGTLIWRLPAWREMDSVPVPLDRIDGRSFSVASHYVDPDKKENALVVGGRRSFTIYGTDELCAEGRGHCRFAAPSSPHSDGPVTNLVFAHPGERLLLASTGEEDGKGIVNLWDLSRLKSQRRVTYVDSLTTATPVLDIDFGRARGVIAATTESGAMILWDVNHPDEDWRMVHRNPERQALYAVAFSPDGALMASGGKGQQVVFWQVGRKRSGKLTATRTPGTLLQRQGINALTFSPDGSTLAAADAEGNICMYGVDNSHLIGDRSCLRGYKLSASEDGKIEALRFDDLPGGEAVLFTAGRGQPLVAWNSLLWNLADDEGVNEAIKDSLCALAGRNMTGYEWRAVFESTQLDGKPGETCPENDRS